MANAQNSNTFYVDTSSGAGTATSYLTGRQTCTGIMGFGNAATDTVKIYDKDSASVAVGALKLSLIWATAKDAIYYDFSMAPIVFPNGVWVTITGSPQVTLILKGQ